MGKKEELRQELKELYHKALYKKKMVDSASRIYFRQRSIYEDLLRKYKEIDRQLAELDGRLIQILPGQRAPKSVTLDLSRLSNEQKRDLISALTE